VTLEDVAREAGVHYSTVSRALDPKKSSRVNPTTRKHVQAVARRLGYMLDLRASALKRGRSQTIAVVVGDLTNPNVAPVLRGVTSTLVPQGLMPLIAETMDDSENLETVLQHLLSRRVDAILLMGAKTDDGPILRRVRRNAVPILLAVQNVSRLRLPLCCYDDYLGGRLVAEHFLSLGHRRVAQLRGPSDISSVVERCNGFSETAKAGGATEVAIDGIGVDGTVEDGRRLMAKALGSRRAMPTAIFAHHDMMAIGAISAAREHGLRIPDDLSIVGYHDLPPVADIIPAITSVRLPREELGRLSAELMLSMLSSSEFPRPKRLAPILVVRESTGPAPRRSSPTLPGRTART
jgi:LacI family transcriptional regulator